MFIYLPEIKDGGTTAAAVDELIKICILARRESVQESERAFFNAILSQLYEKKFNSSEVLK